MRLLARLFLFWLLLLPLSYIYGMPVLMEKLNDKARAQQFTECQNHLQKEGIAGMLTADQTNQYCSCVSNAMEITEADLIPLIKQQPSERLTAAMKPKVDACNDTLQRSIGEAARALPPTRNETLPDGTQIIHFN